jgi:hypothetical protein
MERRLGSSSLAAKEEARCGHGEELGFFLLELT